MSRGVVVNVGSLFSGIGGFDLGLERAGMRVVWQCESDDFCRRVLAQHWPAIPCFEDVRDLRGTGRESVPAVDVLCGGFPCQDISLAGAGAGITGARSGLWSEYARLIGELEPRWVIVENVSALLARGLGVVLADLSALGYDAEWDCLPASAFGAPHQRDRVWLVAYPNGHSQHDGPVDAEASAAPQPLADADELGRHRRSGELRTPRRRQSENGSPDVAHPDPKRRREGLCQSSGPDERPRQGDALWCGEQLADADSEPTLGSPVAREERSPWAVEPDVGRVAHGVPARMDRVRSLGNALIPQIAQWIGERIMSYETEMAA
jgi:DNA (cytosine-5)-methyltransferase 1